MKQPGHNAGIHQEKRRGGHGGDGMAKAIYGWKSPWLAWPPDSLLYLLITGT